MNRFPRTNVTPAAVLACLFLFCFPLFLSAQTSPTAATAQTLPDNFVDLVHRADAARAQNDVAAAIELYKQAVTLKPDWPDGWWFLGMLQYGAGSFPAARDALTHFIDLTPQAVPAIAVRGLCEFETGDYQQSLRDLRTGLSEGAANEARNESILRYHEALLLTLNGDFEDALSQYRFFARAGVSDPEMLIAIGLAGLRIPVLPKDLRSDWRDLTLAAGSAAFYFLGGNDEEKAEQEFQILFQRFPTAANAHYLRGYLLFAKDPDDSVPEFRRELEIAPANASAAVMLAWALLTRNDFSGALPFAEKAATEEPNLSTAQLVYGRALVETGKVNEGREHLETARKLDPDNLEIHLALVRAYSKSGRKEDATRERLLCLDLAKLDLAELDLAKDEVPVAHP